MKTDSCSKVKINYIFCYIKAHRLNFLDVNFIFLQHLVASFNSLGSNFILCQLLRGKTLINFNIYEVEYFVKVLEEYKLSSYLL